MSEERRRRKRTSKIGPASGLAGCVQFAWFFCDPRDLPVKTPILAIPRPLKMQPLHLVDGQDILLKLEP